MGTPRLALDTSPCTAVFRELVKIAQDDPALARTVRKWMTWEGDASNDLLELSPQLGVAVRMTPVVAPDAWYGPADFRTTLAIDLDLSVPGTNADDLMDLHHAFRRCWHPADGALLLDIQARLRALGAETGEVRMSQPQVRPATDPTNPYLAARAQIQLQVTQFTP